MFREYYCCCCCCSGNYAMNENAFTVRHFYFTPLLCASDVRSNILSKISFTLAIMKLFFQADRWLGTSIHILRVNPASTRRPRDVTWMSPKRPNIRHLQGTFKGHLGDKQKNWRGTLVIHVFQIQLRNILNLLWEVTQDFIVNCSSEKFSEQCSD